MVREIVCHDSGQHDFVVIAKEHGTAADAMDGCAVDKIRFFVIEIGADGSREKTRLLFRFFQCRKSKPAQFNALHVTAISRKEFVIVQDAKGSRSVEQDESLISGFNFEYGTLR